MKTLIIIWLDLTLLIFETIVISSLSKLIVSSMSDYLLSEEEVTIVTRTASMKDYKQIIQLGSAILQFLIVSTYLSVRYCIYFNISNAKMFLRKICTGKSIRPSSETVQLVFVHGISFLLLCGYQEYIIKEWKYYSFDNYNLNDSVDNNNHFEIDYVKGINMILLNPIKEEFLFRLTVVSILCYRMDSKINGVLFSSVLFGLLHCANFFSVKNEYASSYVYLQCIFAFLIGIFYGLEMVLTDNIINVIILHIVNNIFASFVPIKRKIDLNDPIITSLLFVTICIYSYYCYYGYHRLIKKMEEQDWSVVEEGEEGEEGEEVEEGDDKLKVN